MSATHPDFLRHLRSVMAKETISALPDQQLLKMFLHQRSQAAFAALVYRHGPMVFGACRRLLRHTQDAEDAFQAVFLALAQQAASIRRQEALGSWLHGVACRIAAKMKHAAARRAVYEGRLSSRPSGDALDDIAWRELRSALDEELQSLSEKHRAPLVLCYLEARTQDEAARQLGWSKNTFARRMRRARQLLAQRLTRRGLTLPAAVTAPLLLDAAAQAVLPPLLAATTVRTGLDAAMGQATATLVSPQVAALAESGVAPLLMKKASVAVVLLVLLTLGVGGLLAHRTVKYRTSTEAPPAPTPPPPPRSGSTGQAVDIKIKGRVLDSAGNPLASARVYLSSGSEKDKTDLKSCSRTDAEGRFRFTANPAEVDRNALVVASAAGYGPDWVPLSQAVNGKADSFLTLRLVKDDVPIKGRIRDLEGRPIAGATVRLLRVLKMSGEDLAPWLKELRTNPKHRDADYFYDEIMSSVSCLPETPRIVKTDADGRFTLHGFGRDRVVLLRVEGAGIEYRRLSVTARPGLTNLPPDMYGPEFDHVAAPSKPIRGTVRDKATGKPLAGAHVVCYPGAGHHAVSDENGHYEIPGIRKSKDYFLHVRGSSVIEQEKEAVDTPGLQPLTVDFNVESGLIVRVRAREKGSGKPVPGLVEYRVRLDNPSIASYTTFRNNVYRSNIDSDGVCNQVVLPGPGYLAFWARDVDFARSPLKEKHKGDSHMLFGVPVQPLILDQFNAVASINPSAKDPQSRICDIVLERGRSVSGTIADAEGRPLSGTEVRGLRARMPYRAPRECDYLMATPQFTATGLDPRYPRTLVFYHTEKKLGKTLLVRGDEKGPLTVRLEPLGAVAGRLVDAAGKPLTGFEMGLGLDWQQQQVLPEEATVGAINDRKNPLLRNKAITDADGRFRIEGLIAGVRYILDTRHGETYFGCVRESVTGKSGATVDVGDIKMKEPAD